MYNRRRKDKTKKLQREKRTNCKIASHGTFLLIISQSMFRARRLRIMRKESLFEFFFFSFFVLTSLLDQPYSIRKYKGRNYRGDWFSFFVFLFLLSRGWWRGSFCMKLSLYRYFADTLNEINRRHRCRVCPIRSILLFSWAIEKSVATSITIYYICRTYGTHTQ